jgi:uncharacterized protein YdeI (YjbR/CyaY-like superfamily)
MHNCLSEDSEDLRSVDQVKSNQNTADEIPVLLFKHRKDWAVWLNKNHAASPGIWMRLARKGSDLTSISYAEALEEALCFGWIDGQKKPSDKQSWLQKFTPRGARSIWSRINREKAQTLIESGRMKPAGLQAIERARQDGRWDAAYDSQGGAIVPSDFQGELDRHSKAKAFFATLNSKNRYAILFRIQTVREAETRARRIRQFIEMLEKNENLYP